MKSFTVIFGIMNPLLAKLTPYLVQTMSTTLAESGISVQKITVDATTSWTQFYKNIPFVSKLMIVPFWYSLVNIPLNKRRKKISNIGIFL